RHPVRFRAGAAHPIYRTRPDEGGQRGAPGDQVHRAGRHLDRGCAVTRSMTQSYAIAAVLGAMVLVVLDAAIANIAPPSIARSLDVTPAVSVIVITAYQTALL